MAGYNSQSTQSASDGPAGRHTASSTLNAARILTPAVAYLLILSLVLGGCATSGSGDGSSESLDPEVAAERGAQAWRSENYDEAMGLLQQAALQGNARAQYAVGYMYYNGQGVEQDVDKALPWFRRAANQGDKRARQALQKLSRGISRQKQPDAASDTSEQGDPDSRDASPGGDDGSDNNGSGQTRVPDNN